MIEACTCNHEYQEYLQNQDKYIRNFVLERVADTLKAYGILNIRKVAVMNCNKDSLILYSMVKNAFLNIRSYTAFIDTNSVSNIVGIVRSVVDYYDNLDKMKETFNKYGNVEYVEGSMFSTKIDTDILIIPDLINNIHDKYMESFEENIFGNIQPKVAIITTPNLDYGKEVPDAKYTRDAFVEWLNKITSKYEYNFYLDSISGLARIFWQIGSDKIEFKGCKPTLGAVIYHKDLHVNPVV